MKDYKKKILEQRFFTIQPTDPDNDNVWELNKDTRLQDLAEHKFYGRQIIAYPKTKYVLTTNEHYYNPSSLYGIDYELLESPQLTETLSTIYPTYRDALKSIPKTTVKTSHNRWEEMDVKEDIQGFPLDIQGISLEYSITPDFSEVRTSVSIETLYQRIKNAHHISYEMYQECYHALSTQLPALGDKYKELLRTQHEEQTAHKRICLHRYIHKTNLTRDKDALVEHLLTMVEQKTIDRILTDPATQERLESKGYLYGIYKPERPKAPYKEQTNVHCLPGYVKYNRDADWLPPKHDVDEYRHAPVKTLYIERYHKLELLEQLQIYWLTIATYMLLEHKDGNEAVWRDSDIFGKPLSEDGEGHDYVSYDQLSYKLDHDDEEVDILD